VFGADHVTTGFRCVDEGGVPPSKVHCHFVGLPVEVSVKVTLRSTTGLLDTVNPA